MSNEPKIIVDEDWKSQVEQEKEQLRKQEETEKSAQRKSPDSQQLPPASFPILVSTLSTQALAALGFINDPSSGKPQVNRGMAKHFIDTLNVLLEKTKGNLTSEEDLLLNESLHQLRMAYVAAKNQQADPAPAEKPSTIQLP